MGPQSLRNTVSWCRSGRRSVESEWRAETKLAMALPTCLAHNCPVISEVRVWRNPPNIRKSRTCENTHGVGMERLQGRRGMTYSNEPRPTSGRTGDDCRLQVCIDRVLKGQSICHTTCRSAHWNLALPTLRKGSHTWRDVRLAPFRTNLVKLRPILDESVSSLAEIGPSVVEFGPSSVDSGPNLADVEQIWAIPGHNWSKLDEFG